MTKVLNYYVKVFIHRDEFFLLLASACSETADGTATYELLLLEAKIIGILVSLGISK